MCMEQINRGGQIRSRKEYLKTAEVKVSLYIRSWLWYTCVHVCTYHDGLLSVIVTCESTLPAGG